MKTHTVKADEIRRDESLDLHFLVKIGYESLTCNVQHRDRISSRERSQG